ncbi:MAG: uroporphyrinogen decarboxylase [Paracoccaceae bacterium]
MAAKIEKSLLRVLNGEVLATPPVWLMRQAGRYLPEYRATRATAGGFLELCYSPDHAVEVTLQPIRRFGFDAAILFADILLLPQALGAELWFETGEGPRLKPVETREDFKRLNPVDAIHDTLSPIYETVRRLIAELPKETTLIGFAGAPWTVATYMIAGRGTPDQGPARRMMYNDRALFADLIELLTVATTEYLARQIEAGAEVVKLFDSWAGALSGSTFEDFSLKPMLKIARALKDRFPHVKVIGFPRGVGGGYVQFAESGAFDALALDSSVPAAWARDVLQPAVAVQGNLDPMLLITGGAQLRNEVERLKDILGKGRWIFNLGHGITPEAEPRHVEELLNIIKG